MGQVFNINENIAPLVKASSTTITMASTYLGRSTYITVGGQSYKSSGTITLNTSAANGLNALDAGALAANTLYYIYAVQQAGSLGLVASVTAPTIGPTGFTSWKEIGRFRTEKAAAAIAIAVNKLIGKDSIPSDSEWESFIPIWSGVVNIQDQSFKLKRNGPNMDVFGYVRMSGAVTGNFRLAVPDNKKIDTSAIITSSNSNVYGIVRYLDSGTAYKTDAQVVYGADNVLIIMSNSSVAEWSASVPIVWGNNDVASFSFSLPIQEYIGL